MAVCAKISKPLNNGTVQVDVTGKNLSDRYYQVPIQNAQAFADNFVKHDKKMRTVTNIATWGSLFGGVLLPNIFLKDKKGLFKYAIGAVSGIAASVAGTFAAMNYTNKQDDKILKQFHARQIYYKI